jgi:uncharacterized protein (AIM24 family)
MARVLLNHGETARIQRGSMGTGEGLVNVFSGTGKVLIQSLNLETFAAAINPFLPQRSS